MEIRFVGFNKNGVKEKGEKDFDLKEFISIPIEDMTKEDLELYKKHKQERNARVCKRMEMENKLYVL